jgi:transcriptional regulator GlxA family with amidase domain
LARAAGLSVSHFNRLFLEWTGFTPMEYQRRQRITKARVLLGDAHLSIKEIAAQCGFDDPYHFSRVFRQLDGLSPSQFREAKLAGRPR